MTNRKLTGCHSNRIVALRMLTFVALFSSASMAFSVKTAAQDLVASSAAKETATLAQSLGDAFIAETVSKQVKKGEPEDVASFLHARGRKEEIESFVDTEMALTASETGEARMEARKNLRRLWWVAAPKLIEYLGSENRNASESARETLVMMRSEPVVEAIIRKLQSSENKEVWIAGLYTLGMMTEKHDTGVPGRTVMGEEQSRDLAERIIKPFLTEAQVSQKDPEIQKVISDAFRLLEESNDRRWRRATNPEEIPEKFRNLPLERPE